MFQDPNTLALVWPQTFYIFSGIPKDIEPLSWRGEEIFASGDSTPLHPINEMDDLSRKTIHLSEWKTAHIPRSIEELS